MYTSSVGIYFTKTRNTKCYPVNSFLRHCIHLLDALQRGLDLFTMGGKIKCFKTCTKLYFAMEEAKMLKREGMLLQYIGAAVVRDTNSNHTKNGTLHRQPSFHCLLFVHNSLPDSCL